ncbi:MAG: nitrilase-related carbon-nitrogen hydrolase, partial [Anaerolineales bacterium]|nr:nitrilase-related carbon-nitrogen hydrolase [Anaerolineales bacterium]
MEVLPPQINEDSSETIVHDDLDRTLRRLEGMIRAVMNSQRISDTTVPAIDLEDLTNIGEDCGQGNLLGIQPYMTPWDYASPEAFYGKLDGYMSVAANQGWLNRKTIAIFPEYIGTWLVALDMDEAVYNASTLAAGMRGALLRTAPRLLITLPRAKGRDRVRDAIFRMKAERISAVFENTFSRLARLYGSTIVAGSLVLPEPVVREGHLLSGAGPLQNVSAVFRPDGSLHRELVRKVHVVADEAPFTGAGAARALPVYDTPAGRLAVLICADSWYPACYEALREK